MSQFRLLAGVPQHLWLEVPLSALPRGKETGEWSVFSSSIAICRVMLLSGLKHQEKHEVEMGRAEMGQGLFICERD